MFDLTGKKFGRLLVIRQNGRKWGQIAWLCLCDCGNNATIDSKSIRTGHTISCGCFNKEIVSKTFKKHGLSKHPLHKLWRNIKDRCYNTNNKAYKYYGGRGICVCKEWINNFESFYDFAVSSGWEKGLEIDRIDCDGDYEPSNCRFVNDIIQSQNRRCCKL